MRNVDLGRRSPRGHRLPASLPCPGYDFLDPVVLFAPVPSIADIAAERIEARLASVLRCEVCGAQCLSLKRNRCPACLDFLTALESIAERLTGGGK